jgi:spore coat protein SA
MNVLMICTEKLPVPNIRGGAVQTYICGVSGLLSRHHQLTIMGRSDPELPYDEVKDGIHYVRVDSDGMFDYYAMGVIDYLRKHSSEFDIIHIFNRPKLVSLVLSMHNDMFKPDKISFQEGTNAVAMTETIITISSYIGQEICRYFPEAASKVKTIYSGVDLDRFAPWMHSAEARAARDRIRAANQLTDKKIILFVGRLSSKKGPHVLVRAMSELQHSDAVLVIVGGAWFSDNSISDYVAYVRAIAARSPVPVVTTGYIPADQVHQWFCAGDVFVCTSLWEEPLARVHYEAMAAGLPFLTTARGGNPEIVRNGNGMIIEHPEETYEYSQKLNMLLADPNRRYQMGMAGRELAERHFTWERVASEITEVWQGK